MRSNISFSLSSCFPQSCLPTPTENVRGSNRPYDQRGRQLFVPGSGERGFTLPHAQVSPHFPPGHGDGDSAPLCPRLSGPPPSFGSPTKVARYTGRFSKRSSYQQHRPPFRPPAVPFNWYTVWSYLPIQQTLLSRWKCLAWRVLSGCACSRRTELRPWV